MKNNNKKTLKKLAILVIGSIIAAYGITLALEAWREDESNLIGIAGRHPVKESSAEYGKRIKEYTIECIYAGLRSEYPQLFEE